MERFLHSLSIWWRSERLLAEQQLRLSARRIQFNVLALLVALCGVAMLSVAGFFALAPHWGNALAALAVGGIDLLLAVAVLNYASSLQLSEVDMVKEVRDMALNDMEEEVALAQSEIEGIMNEVRGFFHNPVQTLLPGAISPLVSAITRGLSGRK